ncbi:hypothetical protein [Thermus sp. LT1-2-5]|uniref:hypothetical protein n=1 Tax=Thermus sp. LT1-2-5 TaxID=3026935 RepID=UPI0033659A9C
MRGPLRGAAGFAHTSPRLLPHLGLSKPPGLYTTLLHGLDPQAQHKALPSLFPEAEALG